MKKTKLSILLLGMCLGTNVIAQDRPSESLSLMNNLYVGNNLYNGTANVSLPLFEIPIGNLKLSNEISYTSQPFDPNLDESLYGHNWYSNLFGQITRDINKDFLLRKELMANLDVGFAANVSQEVKDRETIDCILQEQNLGNGFTKKQVLSNPNNSDVKNQYLPDKFYFDFFGYKGYFVFDNKGNALVFCENTKIKVLGAGSLASKCYSTTSSIDFQNKNISEIRMIDDKGNTFYFGGSFDATDITFAQFNYTTPSPGYMAAGRTRANYIVSWNLKKVELANGDVIIATYKQGDANIFNNFLQVPITGTDFPTQFPSKAQESQANIATNTSFNRTYSYSTSASASNVMVTKRAILDNIEVVNKNINIKYNYIKDSNSLIHLAGINLNYFGKSESITFNQTPLGGQYYRYFLESIIRNNEQYSFEYYKTNDLPQKGFGKFNKYGYWVGNNDNTEYFDATLLKKITYPTKGYEQYTYEKTDASRWSGLNSSRDFQVQDNILSADANNIPIPRLASKIVNNGIDQYITNYRYKLDNGKSSGIFKYFNPQSDYLNNKKSSPDPLYYNYSQVQEEIINKGKIEYFFTDLITNPDVNNAKYIDGNTITKSAFNVPSNEYQRGKLLRKKIIDSNNQLLREHTYEYQNFLKPETELVDLELVNCSTCKISDENYYILDEVISRKTNTTIPVRSVTAYVSVIPYLLKKEVIKEYINNQVIESQTNIKYKESNIFWHPYPEEVQSTTSTGTSIKKYVYPYELKSSCSGTRGCSDDNTIVGGQFASYLTMINSNIWTPIIEIVKNENNKYSLQENLFHTWPIVPKKIRTSKLNADLDFTNYKISLDKTVDQVNYDVIDNRGNYIQTTDKLGIPTVTIYGYKQSLPILKITGLTYAQLMQILGQPTSSTDYLNLSIVAKSNADIDIASEQSLVDELNTVRNSPSLKSYPITTYTYDPLIGVTSITPPSGVRESYLYDSVGRLEKVVDANGKVLKEMKYNYKN